MNAEPKGSLRRKVSSTGSQEEGGNSDVWVGRLDFSNRDVEGMGWPDGRHQKSSHILKSSWSLRVGTQWAERRETMGYHFLGAIRYINHLHLLQIKPGMFEMIGLPVWPGLSVCQWLRVPLMHTPMHCLLPGEEPLKWVFQVPPPTEHWDTTTETSVDSSPQETGPRPLGLHLEAT